MIEIYEFFRNLSGKSKVVSMSIFWIIIISIFLLALYLYYIETYYCICHDVDYNDVVDGVHMDYYELCEKPL